MAEDGEWPRIAVMGAGAVGCYFGGRLARAGAPVTLIGRQALVDAVLAEGGLFIDSIQFQERVRLVATTDPAAAADAGLVLLCVKTLDTVSAARTLAPTLRPGAVILSLQNGVDNAERIGDELGIRVVPAVVYVAALMSGPATVKHSGRGDLVIGALPGTPGRQTGLTLEAIAAVFERSGVGCRVSENVQGDLWVKLIMNAAYNAMSAVGHATYGTLAGDPGARDVMRAVVDEALAVAKKAGVELPAGDLVESVYRLGTAMPAAISSTAQDLDRGKRTEIDSLNGYLTKKGAALGVPTPVNQTLLTLVKLCEAAA